MNIFLKNFILREILLEGLLLFICSDNQFFLSIIIKLSYKYSKSIKKHLVYWNTSSRKTREYLYESNYPAMSKQ